MYNFKIIDQENIDWKAVEGCYDHNVLKSEEWISYFKNYHHILPFIIEIYDNESHIGFFIRAKFKKIVTIIASPFEGWQTSFQGCSFFQEISSTQRIDNFSKRPLYWSFPEYKEIENELAKLAKCDFKIAYIHWGNEFISYPYTDQRQFAHWLIDLGFDLIVGVHPHVLQGYEIYKKKYIFYSLGNFVFNMPWAPTQYSVILNVDFQTETPEVSYNYVHLDKNDSPQIISPECMPQKYSFPTENKNVCKVEENEFYYAMVYKCMREYRWENYKTII